jgi:hypothetical protein
VTDPQRPRTTPEGHTPEEPAPAELGKRGTPGAGMTPDVPHATDARVVEEEATTGDHAPAVGTDAHADAHQPETHDDEHGHAEPRLGPIDWPAWGYAVLGVLAGLLVVGLFWVAVS